ncbi:hypothetical protein [Algoriphagus antarcticus]|uniref:6-bladed beta-propeller protein n=1 Tax=Algoriphagus antarcticus TaxID=238540 RepID=A0A3E0D6R4_9BACT|nr:hypothetical protein [Algoriphagus antarcticus]REG78346.1 hypothetical protein C8N25_13641 [Algoriphagus antarcticus]
MRLLALLVLLSVTHFGCNRVENETLAGEYVLELVDTLQVDLMYDFGFVTKSVVDGYMLAYTYQDGVFHLINSEGKVQISINRKGEGPKEYNRNLSFVTIFDKMVVFMDLRKLNFYDFNGNWVKTVSYDNSRGSGGIGLPDSDLLFFDSGRFVVPNQNVVDLPGISSHLAMLDTIPLWSEYRLSDITGEFVKSNVGLMDTTGILHSKLKYPNYKSIMWMQDGILYQIPQLCSIVYRFEVGKSLYPIDKFSLEIPNFKDPVGLEVELRTVDNYQLFNKYSAINSFVNYVVPMDNGSFFAIYSTGVSEFEYDNLIEEEKFPEGEFYGYYFDGMLSQGYRISLPKKGSHPSFWKQVTYLGGDKFLFVYENEIERDYYIGGVYSLTKRN